MSPQAKRLVVALIAVVTLVAMVIAAEVAVRVRQHLKYGTAAVAEDYYTVDTRTNLRVPIPGFTDGRISINRLGFRGPDIPAE